MAEALAGGKVTLDVGADAEEARATLRTLPGDRTVDRRLHRAARARPPRRHAVGRPRRATRLRPVGPGDHAGGHRRAGTPVAAVALLRHPPPVGRPFAGTRPGPRDNAPPCRDQSLGPHQTGRGLVGPTDRAPHRSGVRARVRITGTSRHLDTDGRDANSGVLDDAAAQLDQYFDGARQSFDLPMATTGSPFQRQVWAQLLDVPFGTTVSYGQLAERLGRSGAARAVGHANARNPIPIVVPCHRVIGSTGRLTGYGGGLERSDSFSTSRQGVRLRGPVHDRRCRPSR